VDTYYKWEFDAVSQKIHLQACGGTFDRKTRTTTNVGFARDSRRIDETFSVNLTTPHATALYSAFFFIYQFKQKSFKTT